MRWKKPPIPFFKDHGAAIPKKHGEQSFNLLSDHDQWEDSCPHQLLGYWLLLQTCLVRSLELFPLISEFTTLTPVLKPQGRTKV